MPVSHRISIWSLSCSSLISTNCCRMRISYIRRHNSNSSSHHHHYYYDRDVVSTTKCINGWVIRRRHSSNSSRFITNHPPGVGMTTTTTSRCCHTRNDRMMMMTTRSFHHAIITRSSNASNKTMTTTTTTTAAEAISSTTTTTMATSTTANDGHNHHENRNLRALSYMGYGIIVLSFPISIWWYCSYSERTNRQNEYNKILENRRTSPILQQDTYDYIISNKCLPGDIILFDRKCETCCSSPWAAFSCCLSKSLLCHNTTTTKDDRYLTSIDDGGRYDHIGIIVPGYGHDKYDPLNVALLEATPSGIVARPLKERIEQSSSRTILLLQLNIPGEERNKILSSDEQDDPQHMSYNQLKQRQQQQASSSSLDSRQLSILRTREHIDQQLCQFRDTWITLSQQRSYHWMHSTVSIGGALWYGSGLSRLTNYTTAIVSPAAFFVLCALQKSFVAPSYHDRDNHAIKVEDYLRDHKIIEHDAIRLRPGYRFLTPIPIKDQTRK